MHCLPNEFLIYRNYKPRVQGMFLGQVTQPPRPALGQFESPIGDILMGESLCSFDGE
jgi:hypothetical protein